MYERESHGFIGQTCCHVLNQNVELRRSQENHVSGTVTAWSFLPWDVLSSQNNGVMSAVYCSNSNRISPLTMSRFWK